MLDLGRSVIGDQSKGLNEPKENTHHRDI
jgi:hypothetical protein